MQPSFSVDPLKDALIRTVPRDVDLVDAHSAAKDLAPEYVRQVGEPEAFVGWESESQERWVFAVRGGEAQLFRIAGEEILEIRFLGSLWGGDYTEWLSDGALRFRFDHPRLDGPLALEAKSPAAIERLAPLRNALRRWAAEQAPPTR